MEFNEKLQELRKQNGLTQEELASQLYVTRTAVSKWESGRGYPNIDSLKAIARFFGVTVDELLSTDEVLVLAEEEEKTRSRKTRELIYSLVDIMISLLLFLPVFALRSEGGIQNVSLLFFDGAPAYIRIPYLVGVIGITLIGALTLALLLGGIQQFEKGITVASLSASGVASLIFIITLQPYAAVFTLTLLAIKVLLLIKKN